MTSTKKGTSLDTLEGIFLQGIRLQRHGFFKKLWKLQTMFKHAIGSSLRRKRILRRKGLQAPIAIAFSPTMHCNLSCDGCYARDYPRDNELSLDEIGNMLTSAEEMGVFLFVITGGEPLMRDGILGLFKRHRRLLFLMITNGKLLDDSIAKEIAHAGNIIPVVSLEGSLEQTDVRRGYGIYDRVKRAMEYLQSEGAVFGFSAMVTRENFQTLSSNEFIQEMIDRGCALGFYTEYIPVGSAAQWELVLEDRERELFREKILEFRRNKPIMIVHLPDDEYEPNGRCRAVAGGCVHINAQGYIEPCPFTHFASDNIREKGLDEALRSQFLTELRASHAVFRRGQLGCALFENMEILQDIASRTGAKPTDHLLSMAKRI